MRFKIVAVFCLGFAKEKSKGIFSFHISSLTTQQGVAVNMLPASYCLIMPVVHSPILLPSTI
jgi:hypothetical protein